MYHCTSHSAPARKVMSDLVKHIETLRGSRDLFCQVPLYIDDVLRLENDAALKPSDYSIIVDVWANSQDKYTARKLSFVLDLF